MEEILGMLEWPAMAISLAAAWLIASKDPKRRVRAFWMLIAGNVLWIGWGWGDAAYALIVLNAGLMAMNVRGIFKNEA